MKIKVGQDGYLEGCVFVGDMDGAVDYNGIVPEDIRENCRFYKLQDGQLIFDSNRQLQNQAAAAARLEVADLQAALGQTDYKIIKSYEYALAGEPQPYDIVQLHAERQAIRDRINILEVEVGGDAS